MQQIHFCYLTPVEVNYPVWQVIQCPISEPNASLLNQWIPCNMLILHNNLFVVVLPMISLVQPLYSIITQMIVLLGDNLYSLCVSSHNKRTYILLFQLRSNNIKWTDTIVDHLKILNNKNLNCDIWLRNNV